MQSQLKLLLVMLCCAALSSSVMAQRSYASHGYGSRPNPGAARHTGSSSTRYHLGRQTSHSGAHQRPHRFHGATARYARPSAQGHRAKASAGSSSIGPPGNGSQPNNSSGSKFTSGLTGPRGGMAAPRLRNREAPDNDDHSSANDQRFQSELLRQGGMDHRTQGTTSRSYSRRSGNGGRRPNGSHPTSRNRGSGH